MRIRPAAGALAIGLALSLAATLGLSATGAAADDRKVSTPAAKQALSQAQAALSGTPKKEGRDVTMALRNLFVTQDGLAGADAEKAASILARPTEPGDEDYYGPGADVKDACTTNLCLHWVETGPQAATPSYAATTLQTLDDIHEMYVDAGYRPTLPDEGQEGNTLPDIYLANIGDRYYGYCTSDATGPVVGSAYYAYCVLDNDYTTEEFPTNTPLENMQVTAAHEYFHAVQYAYDGEDDTWIYETTATWAEDETYDDVNDNINYLPYGQLGDPDAAAGFEGEGPGVSLDLADFPYGNWIFFRYLTEKYTTSQAGMPTLVRDIWRDLDTTGAANNRYSLQAVVRTLDDRGSSMKKQYSKFALENNTPQQTYEEGADQNYPYPAYAFKPVQLRKGQKSASRTVKLDHLTSGTGAFLPFGKGWDLKVKVDMTKKKAGSTAAVAVYKKNGDVDRSTIKLNKKGNGKKKVPFSTKKIAGVEVTLVNASTQMVDCFAGFPYSCSGAGKYENQKQKVKVTAVK